MAVYFQSENKFELNDDEKNARAQWVISAIEASGNNCGELTYIFCSDDFLLDLNQRYLQHDTFTDIITFDYSQDDLISGDIFISTERVRENAAAFEVDFKHELARVMIHGVLHLLGFDDHSEEDKKKMRAEEDRLISTLIG